MKIKLSSFLFITVFAVGNIFSEISVLAQVTTDGTTSTTFTPTDTGVQIENGNRSGDNLFHSFDEFSVPTNTEAHFNNANDVVNIFSRVTGGNISNIDGMLRANGAANLFLINPAGIILGENARLQLGGSFYGSTADSIIFPNGEFSATDLDNPPLITINAPIGLSFRDNPNSINVRGNGNGVRFIDSEIIDTQEALRVDSSATIGLIGGNLIFEDATIKTPGGSIELGSVAGGEVDVVEVANGFSFDYSRVDNFQDISLSGSSNLDASGLGGGDIRVAGKNITIGDISIIEANTLGGENAGDIQIFAAESITISGIENEDNFISAISNRVFSNGTADGGDINLETQNLILGDRSLITTTVSGQGNAGKITINASESVSLFSEGNTSAIATNVGSDAIGNGGDISITTPSLSLSNGAFFNANTSGQGNAGSINFSGNSLTLENGAFFVTNANSSQGNAGNIIVNANDTVSLNGQGTGFFTNVRTAETIGNGGEINITTGSFTLNNGATLNANTSGQGNAGNITVNATESITLSDENIDPDSSTLISANAFDSASGNAGNIALNTGFLTLDNATLRTSSSANTSAGNITINATEDVALTNNSTIFVTGADEGSVTIEAQNVEFKNGSNIDFGTFEGFGFANSQTGDITISTSDDISLLNGSSIQMLSVNEGSVGDVILTAGGNISLLNGSQIFTASDLQGNIGNITLQATGDIIVDSTDRNFGQSQIVQFLATEATGNVGVISLQSQNLTLNNGSAITSLVERIANSGNIEINVLDTIIVDGFVEEIQSNGTTIMLPSSISSTVGESGNGNSGDINISTKNLFLSRNGLINSSIFGQGNAGNINIDAQKITLAQQGNIERLPSSISSQAVRDTTDPNNLVTESNAGNITINTDSLSIRDGGNITTDMNTFGEPGRIKITATDSLIIEGTGSFRRTKIENINTFSSRISASATSNAVANGGDIEINTGNLSVTNQALISTSSAGDGDAGNITLDISDTFSANGSSSVVSNIGNSQGAIASGKVGNITIDAEKIALSDTAQIQAGAFSGGTVEQPGIISLTAVESIFFTGENTGIFSNNDLGSSGNASDTKLSAPIITLDNSAVITADNQADGQGGNIIVETEKLTLRNGSQIGAATFGDGDAGSVIINATKLVDISGVQEQLSSGVFANALTGNGKGGDISIYTDKLTVSDGAIITASNFSSLGFTEPGTGEAGSLRIEANSVTLSNEARISTATQSGDEANIILTIADTLTLRENSFISARAFQDATGGNVTINTDFIIAFPSRFDGNDIRADAQQGQGGRISITAESVFGIAESQTLNPLTNDINASSQVSGLEGTISINTPDINPLRGSSDLPSNPIPTNTLATTNACNLSSVEETSNLMIKGKGGILPQITNPLTADYLIIEHSTVSLNSINQNRARNDGNPLVNTSDDRIKPAIETEETGKIYAARGIIQQEDGTIYLTAYPTSHQSRTTGKLSFDCFFN